MGGVHGTAASSAAGGPDNIVLPGCNVHIVLGCTGPTLVLFKASPGDKSHFHFSFSFFYFFRCISADS